MGHHFCVPWLNQGDNRWPPAIATQLEKLFRLRLFAHTRRQVELKDHGRIKTKDIQREGSLPITKKKKHTHSSHRGTKKSACAAFALANLLQKAKSGSSWRLSSEQFGGTECSDLL